jgi:maleamate amidohydrolase
MSDVYAARGYGARPVGFGEKPAVVVIDFQKGFTDPSFPMGSAPMVSSAVEKTVSVMHAAKKAGAPVIACVIAFDSKSAAPRWKVDPVLDLMAGSVACELDERIAAAQPDVVLHKTAPSLFFGTPAGAILTRERIDTVIVTGCITSGCVRASIVDSFSLGFRTIVPEDCVGDHEPEPHQDNLRDVERRYADVCTADDVIRQIELWRGRNQAG